MKLQVQNKTNVEEAIRLEEAIQEYKAGLERQPMGECAQDNDAGTIREITLLKCSLCDTSNSADCLPVGTELALNHIQNGDDNKWRIEVSSADGIFLGTLPKNEDQVTARLMDAGKMVGARVIDEMDPEYDLIFKSVIAEDMRVLVEVYLKVVVRGAEGRNE